MMNREDLIRAATIIDCEGSVAIYKVHDYYKGRKKIKNIRLRPQVSAANTEKWYLEKYVKDVLGFGSIYPSGSKSAKKQCWQWQTTYRQALKVCKILLPFLIIKKEKALKIIQHYEEKDKTSPYVMPSLYE